MGSVSDTHVPWRCGILIIHNGTPAASDFRFGLANTQASRRNAAADYADLLDHSPDSPADAYVFNHESWGMNKQWLITGLIMVVTIVNVNTCYYHELMILNDLNGLMMGQ